MTRMLPAVLAGVTVGIAGMRQGARLKADAARMARWQALLRHLLLLLREGAYSLPEAFEHAAVQHAPPDEMMRRLAALLREQPLIPLNQHYAALAADGPEHDVLLRLMQRLGHGTQEARCLACEQACEELALLHAQAAAKADKDAKMWTSLGWTVGACLALMLI